MGLKAVTFDKWDQDYGDRGARWAAGEGPGWYTALNMWKYDNGAIGPRPGLKKYTLTSAPNGNVRALGYYAETPRICYVVGTGLYSFNPVTMTSQAVVTATGTLNAGTEPVAFGGYLSADMYLTHRDDTSYTWNQGTNTLAAIFGSPGGRCMVRYQDRFYVGDTGAGQEQRVAFSNAADFATWDWLSYFDVDYDYNIFSLHAGSSRLIIHSSQNVWVMTGTPGTNSLRQVLRAGGVGLREGTYAVVPDGDEYWFVCANKFSPGWTNAALYDTVRYDMLKLDSSTRMFGSPAEPTMLMLGVTNQLIRHNDTWTRHSWGETLAVVATDWGSGEATNQGYFVITTTPGASAPADFYCFDANNSTRPGFTSDTYSNVGDGSSTPETMYLYTSEVLSKDGSELTVREVKVDFTKWATGSASTNHFDIKVRATALYDTSGSRDSQTEAFDEAGTSATTTGVEQRANFTFGDQGSGAGFQIRLDNIRGCAIRAIHVIYDESPGRAR